MRCKQYTEGKLAEGSKIALNSPQVSLYTDMLLAIDAKATRHKDTAPAVAEHFCPVAWVVVVGYAGALGCWVVSCIYSILF